MTTSLQRKKLEEYVLELLSLHPCVIIPDFGGFLSRDVPAGLQSDPAYIHPPARKVVFNASLNQNDGLLAHHIATEHNIPYDVATAQIESTVRYWLRKLELQKELMLEGLGSIFLSEDQRLTYLPDPSLNLNLAVFGLSSLVLPEVSSLSTLDSEVLAAEESVIEEVDEEFSKRASIFRAGRIAASFALLALISFFGYQYWHSTAHSEIAANQASVIAYGVKSDSTALANTNSTDSSATDPSVSTAPITDPVSESVSTPEAGSPDYEVIAGAFGKKSNARKLVTNLKENGYASVHILGKREGRLYRVSFKSFPDSLRADNFLQQLKTEHPDAWILKWN